MSDDPQTLAHIAGLKLGRRSLVVLDVDEVVLEFLRPFTAFLESEGLRLKAESFRLTGNVLDMATGEAVDGAAVRQLLEGFFASQNDWQAPAEGAVAAIDELSQVADVVLLTAMPHRHFEARRTLLTRHGIAAPLVTTEAAKGPAIAAMRAAGTPVAFVDDLPGNLLSARTAIPDIHLIHLMADPVFRALLPPMPDGIHPATDWPDAGAIIAARLGL